MQQEVILITGANSGVGYGIVERYLQHYLPKLPPVLVCVL
jgi:NADP-dependent 3-hydroxy acid dehydrogenase YdfG